MYLSIRLRHFLFEPSQSPSAWQGFGFTSRVRLKGIFNCGPGVVFNVLRVREFTINCIELNSIPQRFENAVGNSSSAIRDNNLHKWRLDVFNKPTLPSWKLG